MFGHYSFSFFIDQKMYQYVIFHIKTKLPPVPMTSKITVKEKLQKQRSWKQTCSFLWELDPNSSLSVEDGQLLTQGFHVPGALMDTFMAKNGNSYGQSLASTEIQ